MKTLALLAMLASPDHSYKAQVVQVVDGDSIQVTVPAWRNTPFYKISLRVDGIDTPESLLQFAKCPKELALGRAASAYARTLVKPGDPIRFVYKGHDKYFRIDAQVKVGRKDWAQLMTSGGYAVIYSGGTKQDWCKS